MEPTSFDQSNAALSRPTTMSDHDCEPLSIWRGMSGNIPVVVSCWKLSVDELEEFRQTGRVWLYIVGDTMPPVLLTGRSPWPEPPPPAGQADPADSGKKVEG